MVYHMLWRTQDIHIHQTMQSNGWKLPYLWKNNFVDPWMHLGPSKKKPNHNVSLLNPPPPSSSFTTKLIYYLFSNPIQKTSHLVIIKQTQCNPLIKPSIMFKTTSYFIAFNIYHDKYPRFHIHFSHGEGLLTRKSSYQLHPMDTSLIIVKWYSFQNSKITYKSKNKWVIIFNKIIIIKTFGH